MNVADLESPALVIDLEKMERNLRRAAEYTAAHNLRFCPHTKTTSAVGLISSKVGLLHSRTSRPAVAPNATSFANWRQPSSAVWQSRMNHPSHSSGQRRPMRFWPRSQDSGARAKIRAQTDLSTVQTVFR